MAEYAGARIPDRAKLRRFAIQRGGEAKELCALVEG